MTPERATDIHADLASLLEKLVQDIDHEEGSLATQDEIDSLFAAMRLVAEYMNGTPSAQGSQHGGNP